MKGAFNLGKLFNVKIEVHWTFFLILIWVAFLEIKNGGNTENVLMSIVFILLLFVCVVLHEFGHILMARRFGVVTKKITLLPIGGVASMERIPENPKQELLVAVAGPMVNIFIASVLFAFLPAQLVLVNDPAYLETLLSSLTFKTLAFYLFFANVVLAIFNFVPAFPMDGGRVLRALLAMRMDRIKATNIAARIGQFISLGFLILGLLYNPFLILIALFIFIGAGNENKMEQQLAILKGHQIREAMLTNISILKPDNTIKEVLEILLAGNERNFIVADRSNILGILYHQDIIKNSKNENTLVKDLMSESFESISINDELKDIFKLINASKKDFFAVLENGKLAGAINLNNVSEFILINSNLILNPEYALKGRKES